MSDYPVLSTTPGRRDTALAPASLGTAGQRTRVNAAADAPEWSDPDLVCTAAELATTYAPSAVLRGVIAYTSDTLATYICRRTAAATYAWTEVGGGGETALPRLPLDGALHHWRLDDAASPFADLGSSPVALVQTTGAREYGRAGVYARYDATMMRSPAANDRADAALSDVTGAGDITLGVTVAAEGGALRSSDYAVIVALHTGVAYQDSLMILARNESVAAYAYQTGVGNRITADVAIPWSVPHRIEAIYRVSTGLTTLYVDGVARAVTDYSLPMGALPYASLGGVAQTIPGVVAGSVLAADVSIHASALSSAQQIARADIVRRLAMG